MDHSDEAGATEVELPALPRFARPSARPSAGTSWRPLAWTFALAVLVTLGLALLTWMLFLAFTLSSGMLAILRPDSGVGTPDAARFLLAFVIGAVIVLTGSAGGVWALRRQLSAWPLPLQGLVAVGIAGVLGVSALLLVLGIDPLDVLLAP